MADYYIDGLIDMELDRMARDYATHYHGTVNTDYWITNNGTRIKFSDMTMEHLQNSKRMMERNGKKHAWQYDRLCEEISNRNKPKQAEREVKMKKELATLKVVGVTFTNEDGSSRQKIIGAMTPNSPVILKREPQNSYDKNAVAVFSIDGQVGYLGRDYSGIIAPMMDVGRKLTADVKEVSEYKGTNYLHINIYEEVTEDAGK